MRLSKTFIFLIATVGLVYGVYHFDYKAEKKEEATQKAFLLSDTVEHISYIQIAKENIKIGLQKKETGWDLLEPLEDYGDNESIESFLNDLSNERQIDIIKTTNTDFTETELSEYGLDKPVAIFNFKNNNGRSQKISVGSIKNYEGLSFLRLDNDNKIILGSAKWYAYAESDLIFYREKKLFRNNPAHINKIKIKSLRDSFELVRENNEWHSERFKFDLDQNKVREILKKSTETKILDYIVEGEPSAATIADKGLNKKLVIVELFSDNNHWSAIMNVKTEDKALYVLTERPTYLVKTEPISWEFFGNLTLDSLRDRTSAFIFKMDEVKKIYFKNNEKETSLFFSGDKWQPSNNAAGTLNDAVFKRTMGRISDLKIAEFVNGVNTKEKFEGKNMLILKSDTDKLVLQLNWGPLFKMKKNGQEKEYYYARTHKSELIFALEKHQIDSLEFDDVLENSKKNEAQIE